LENFNTFLEKLYHLTNKTTTLLNNQGSWEPPTTDQWSKASNW